jgi:hypothetical protein
MKATDSMLVAFVGIRWRVHPCTVTSVACSPQNVSLTDIVFIVKCVAIYMFVCLPACLSVSLFKFSMGRFADETENE